MSLLHDAVPNEVIFAVLDHVVSSPFPPYIQKTLLALAATCRRFRDLITPIVTRLQALQLTEMMHVGMLKLRDREGQTLHSILPDGKQPASSGPAGVASITFIIMDHAQSRTASRFANLSALMNHPTTSMRWTKNFPDVADIWAVRRLVTSLRSLRQFTLEFRDTLSDRSSKSFPAVAALINACAQHQGISFTAEGDFHPWDLGMVPPIPLQSRPQPAAISKRSHWLRAVKCLVPRRTVPESPVISGPSQLHLHSDVLFGPPHMLDSKLCILQPSLTHLSVRANFFRANPLHPSSWSLLFESCNLPLLQVLSLDGHELSLSDCFDFLLRHPSLVTLSLDTNPISANRPKKIKPSAFLPNLTKLSASPGNIAALLFHPKALPKLHTLVITRVQLPSNYEYYWVLRFLEKVRHRSVMPVSWLTFIFAGRAKGCELIQKPADWHETVRKPQLRRTSFRSVTILYTGGRTVEDWRSSAGAVRLRMILPWMEWLRECPVLETFRIDGMVRDIRITRDGIEEPPHLDHTYSQARIATHIREGMSTNRLPNAMWNACPRLQAFSIEGDIFKRPDTSLVP